MEYIWAWFWEAWTGNPLNYQELESWARLTGKQLQVFEVELLMALNRIKLTVNNV